MTIPINGLNHQPVGRDDSDSDSDIVNGHESDGDFSDTSSVMTEVGDEEIPGYFEERAGRLFHSHGGLPYPLPVDTPEQERMNGHHRVLQRLIKSNFVGPVPEVLALDPDRRKKALDICTGTGVWVNEMASMFPHAKFCGFDIVPIATRNPRPNVQFEVDNVNNVFRQEDGSMDLVHARSVSMAVVDYCAMLTEVARVLRPGGLFLSGEWERIPTFVNPALRDQNLIPFTTGLLTMVDNILFEKYGIRPWARQIPGWLEASGLFVDITLDVHCMPVGNWHGDPDLRVLGRDFVDVWVKYAGSLEPMLSEAGFDVRFVQHVLAGYLHEIQNVSGMCAVYYTVHARRA